MIDQEHYLREIITGQYVAGLSQSSEIWFPVGQAVLSG